MLFLPFVIFFGGVIGLALLAFWIWMLVDCLTRPFKRDSDKIAWVLVIIFLHLVGAIIYFFVIKTSRKQPKAY